MDIREEASSMTKELSLNFINWRQWLLPRPIDALAALFYAGTFTVYNYLAFSGFYQGINPWFGSAVVTIAILSLIVIDRLEYRYLGEQSSWPTMLALLLVRVIIIVIASLSDGLGLGYRSLFFLIIPFGFFFVAGDSFGFFGLVCLVFLFSRLRGIYVWFLPNLLPRVFLIFFVFLSAV